MTKPVRSEQKFAPDFSLPPEDFFFTPGKHEGISFLEPPQWFWRERDDHSDARGVAVSGNDEMNRILNAQIKRMFKNRHERVTEINAIPIRIEDATFSNSFIGCNGRWLLNGAAGSRLRVKHFMMNRTEHYATARYLTTEGLGRSNIPIPVKGYSDEPLDLTLDTRNLFNFYHFTTETLCDIASFPLDRLRGKLKIHTPGNIARGFPARFVLDFFPELIDRLEFIDDAAGIHYRQTYNVLGFGHMFYQLSEKALPEDLPVKNELPLWKTRKATNAESHVIGLNSYSASLRRLREVAFSRTGAFDAQSLPKRFMVGRRASESRPREFRNGEVLEKVLVRNGFDVVYFEDLSPLHQVAVMKNCEVMVTPHGAGLTNMLFASSTAHICEIGNVDSMGGRWSGFIRLANVAGCRYTNFLADRHSDFANKRGLAPIEMSHAAIDAVAEAAIHGSAKRDTA